MSTEDPLAPMVKVAEQLKKVAEELGLTMEQFALSPDTTGHGAHIAHAVFSFDKEKLADTVEKTDEQRAIDAQVADMERDFLKQQEEEKMAEASEKAQQLAKSLRESNGILDED
jgi:methionine salvage enolase-phosphatase E1